MKIIPFSSFLFLLTVFLFMLILIDFQGQGFEIFVGKLENRFMTLGHGYHEKDMNAHDMCGC